MAKLLRYTQKLFASNASANQLAEFGSLSAGTPARYSGSTITPTIVQTLSNYLTGWFGAVIGQNSPAIEDMNALQWLNSYQLSYLMQSGVAEWDSGTTYYIGSYVSDGAGNLYYSLIDNNLNNVVSNTGDWKQIQTAPYSSSNEVSNLGLSNSVSTGALTIALKQSDGSTNPTSTSPVIIGMRSSTSTNGLYNLRSISSALSFTLSSGTLLAFRASTLFYLYIYAIDSDGAGTMKLGASINLYDDASLQSSVAESFTCTISNASPGVITANGHGLNNNDSIQFTTTGSLPTGLSTSTTYYIVNKATNTFNVAATPAGTAINTSSAGSGVHTIHINTVNGQMVSDGVYSNKPIRWIGRMAFTLVTPGTWLVASEIALSSESLTAQSKIITKYYRSASASVTAGNPINFDTLLIDNRGAVVPGTTTWVFVAPQTSNYLLNGVGQVGAGTVSVYSLYNGSANTYVGSFFTGLQSVNGIFQLNAGDRLSITPDTTVSVNGGLAGGAFAVTLSITQM